MNLPFDRAHLSTFTGGDMALERELLLQFQRTARLHLEALEQAEMGPPFCDAAHRFKGAASGMGMRTLARLCSAAEELGLKAEQRGELNCESDLFAKMRFELGRLDTYLSQQSE